MSRSTLIQLSQEMLRWAIWIALDQISILKIGTIQFHDYWLLLHYIFDQATTYLNN